MSIFKYKKFDIEVIENNGNALIEVYTLGQALGHTRWNGEKTCQSPRRGVIDALLKKAKINPFLLEEGKYITIDGVEKLIDTSKSQEKENFKKWFSKNKDKLLNADKLIKIAKSSQKHFKYSTALKRRKVLLNVNIEELAKEIILIMKNVNEKDKKERKKIIKHMQKTILDRRV